MSSTQRDDIRSRILATHALASEKLMIFGAEVELRQPTLSDVLAIQDAKQDSTDGSIPVSSIAKVLIQYSYVPGTQEKVFEEGDSEAIMGLPFGDDMVRVSTALEKLTKVNFTQQADSSNQGQISTS